RHRMVVVNGWKEVARHETDDFAVSVDGDKRYSALKRDNCVEAVGNF
ncbi:MAG: hypothetical protein QOJ16_5111, partial [Acidobacteriota bacterium]|nr:hypothetical protein [Acidobacteriota bacterium]